VLLRILLLFVILLFSLLGYVTFLNHEIQVTLFLVQGKPVTTSLPAVIIISFASGALIIFIAALIRDLVEGWRELRGERKGKKGEALQAEIAKGLGFLFRGNVDRGRIHLANALKRDPENLAIYAKLSDIYANQGNLTEAIEILKRAEVIDSKNQEILLKRARFSKEMGNTEMAVDSLEKVVATNPNNRSALIDLRDAFLQQKKWKKALETQRNLLRIGKSDDANVSREKRLHRRLKYEYARALTLEGNEESLEKALRLCKEIIKQEKGFQPAYVLLGDIYEKQKRWVEAGRTFGRGFHVSRRAVFLLRLEDLYLKRDDSKTILKIYRRALENDPNNTVIPLLYSRLCLKLEMLEEAMDEAVEMQRRGQDTPALHGIMAEIFTHRGQLDAAVREYKKASKHAGFLKFAFVCRSCQKESTDWLGHCPACSQWNTYVLKGENTSNQP
jgi:tetratricopeptide (TPR) repeat protein